jgi:hypothetical protein
MIKYFFTKLDKNGSCVQIFFQKELKSNSVLYISDLYEASSSLTVFSFNFEDVQA